MPRYAPESSSAWSTRCCRSFAKVENITSTGRTSSKASGWRDAGFARGTTGGNLQVQVIFHGLTGNVTGIRDVASLTGTNGWAPTSRVDSSLALPVLTAYAQIRVTAVSGTWNVDDAFVDPYINGAG